MVPPDIPNIASTQSQNLRAAVPAGVNVIHVTSRCTVGALCVRVPRICATRGRRGMHEGSSSTCSRELGRAEDRRVQTQCVCVCACVCVCVCVCVCCLRMSMSGFRRCKKHVLWLPSFAAS